ncbi:AAA domain-containing protein [Nocardia cyriacigeorgica]|uniref:AAA domain-containing protein n=1 Tax=Nocardia cyriacigeorgica TaxID=135487 RepID=UPI0013D77F6A|nr:AAA domain-containing protein [Nocardia cyriacigeorgica]NEW29398.1 AAA family ATPase [Nocardia cyriacigeorgica]
MGEGRSDQDVVNRAASLFEYLARVQDIGTTRTCDVADLGSVIWLSERPIHQAVRLELESAGSPFLVVGKIRLEQPPQLVDSEVREWLQPGRLDDPEDEPCLRETRPGAAQELRLDDHPEVVDRFEQWLRKWRPWAAQARRDRLASRLYHDLYDMYTELSASSETREAVLGLGCLSWKPKNHSTVRRHVLTVPVKVDFDTDSGQISVTAETSASGLSVELLDFLENTQLAAPGLLRAAEDSARDDGIDPFDRSGIARLVRRLINCIDPSATYQDEMAAAVPTPEPAGAYAPVLILRPRGKRGLVRVLRSIGARIREHREVPEGIRNLVDPEYVPARTATPDDGAIVRDGQDAFLPLQLNPVQLGILDHVDTSAHTIVQGPPGTGKTHTAAALITHLLAQGKRVLVTAQTDRALEEVRGKLRDEIKPLCVAVVGTSRDAFTDLEAAVEKISAAASEYDQARSMKVIEAAGQRIDSLRRQRTEIKERLLRAREREVARHEIAGYSGTLTDIVLRHRDDGPRYEWLRGLATPRADESLPVASTDIEEWRRLLLDDALRDPEVAAPPLLTFGDVAPMADVEQWFARHAAAVQRCREYQHVGSTELVRRIVELTPATRSELQGLVVGLDQQGSELAQSRDEWYRDAIADIRAGSAGEWQIRAGQLAELLSPAEEMIVALGITDVTVSGDDLGPLVSLAEALLARIRSHGEIKTHSDGSPKTGLTAPRVVKDAAPLFERVRVDGRIPASADQLERFRQFAEATRLLNQLDRIWHGLLTPPAGSLRSRLAWHRDRFDQLRQVVRFGTELVEAGAKLRTYGLAEPDWSEPRTVRTLVDAFDAVAAMSELRASEEPIARLHDRVRVAYNDPHNTANIQELYAAIAQYDPVRYRAAYARLGELNELRGRHRRRHELGARMSALPKLRDAIAADPHDEHWPARLAELSSAWNWARVDRWLADHVDEETNTLFHRLDQVESALRDEATVVAVARSWDRAVGPGRLTHTSRSDLRQYVQLVRKLGKGKGQYAARRQIDIQQTLARCRSAVPVWIMPIYRVVEQLDIEQNMFDVVVVDEASQAGLESVFLQYLAPRIVVIGDDKQVSPAGVGIDQNQLRALAAQYLPNDRFRASWEEPQRSLFDEAAMRFPTRLTLVEHRRCVPEIIEFSNRIAYEPQHIRLLPVRLYGADRLPPIRTVYVADAESGKNNVNASEAERIVQQVAQCIDDPKYAGKSFGVISLLGQAQAKLIWDKLVQRLQPEEIARRQLRCGDAADFQGAERDIIFLSMVKAPGPDTRIVAQTREQIVQRYNVAVSRARDQLWLFHSMTLDQLNNTDDMRYQLLNYCLETQRSGHTASSAARPEKVPDDRVVTPFESLFEQRVYNLLVDRGYQVSAHYDAAGHDIDLVVTGAHAKVALECEGDSWDGPEQFHRELARQRDLERCGWPFFRIRQSRFVAGPDACLTPLWQLFDELNIMPIPDDDVAVAGEPSPSMSTSGVGDRVDDPTPTSETMWQADTADEKNGEPTFPHETPVRSVAPIVTVATEPADLTTASLSAAVDAEPPTVPGEFGSVGTDDYADDQSDGSSWSEAVAVVATDEVSSTGDAPSIAEYQAFTGLLTAANPAEANRSTVIAHLVRIVGVEGPVSGRRLVTALLRDKGGVDSGATRDAVIDALRYAVETGDLLEDDPLRLADPIRSAYRLSGQPVSRRRTLGVRPIDEIPARELAETVSHCAEQIGWHDRAALMRAVLVELGQPQLTDRAIAALALVWPFARALATDRASASS